MPIIVTKDQLEIVDDAIQTMYGAMLEFVLRCGYKDLEAVKLIVDGVQRAIWESLDKSPDLVQEANAVKFCSCAMAGYFTPYNIRQVITELGSNLNELDGSTVVIYDAKE